MAGLLARPASGMDFEVVPIRPGQYALRATGEVLTGDGARFREVLSGIAERGAIILLSLDSPGGNVGAGFEIGELVRARRLETRIGDGARCASICFSIFAAGYGRSAGETALIGVHRAATSGEDTSAARAKTVEVAEFAARMGVPPAIIGKMVVTQPQDMAWLTREDLLSMAVQITPTIVPRPVTPLPVASRPIPPMDRASYEAGRRDRVVWDRWRLSLGGSRRVGAEWWAENRYAVSQLTDACWAAGGLDEAFVAGCVQATEILGAIDPRRMAEPDYRRGWDDR
ncbi:hypothetical protein [Roseomonas gilardii]|uniref:COG3904 family protein n=1 Tax=Roseomonas gilardii TaxID=257708 RepID=UPI00119DE1B9|nr:hypothetical protein [Roseomonas gilardii]